MAIGLISAGGLSKEEVIAKSAGLDILAHSLARTGRRRREREREDMEWKWNGNGIEKDPRDGNEKVRM